MEPPTPSQQQVAPEAYEAEYVHGVYEQIAAHFSSTRYKPWPIVESFLNAQPDGSVGLDVGCGNGKYLAVNPRIFTLGSDRSPALTAIASQHEPHSAMVADALMLPHPNSRFDFVISIAVIHHLSTPARRALAIKAILDALKPSDSTHQGNDRSEKNEAPSESGGRALIYVWALEQRGSRRGWDEGCEQDVMVPWVMKGKLNTIPGTGTERQKKTSCQRRGKKHRAVGRKTEGEDSRSNMRETIDTTPSNHSDQVPLPVDADREAGSYEQASPDGGGEGPQPARIFQRYYHLYRSGELERDIAEAGGRVVESGYEKDNWWAIATRG